MARRKGAIIPPEQFVELNFPQEGLDESRRYSTQHKRHTQSAQNVRTFEPATDRARGSSRAGLSKYIASRVTGDYSIQDINHLVTTSQTPATGLGQLTYTLTSGGSWGLASSLGASYATGGTAGDETQCAIWSEDNHVYLIEHTNPGFTADAKVYKVTSAGSAVWTRTITNWAPPSGGMRGMAIVGDYLYLAKNSNGTTSGSIRRINTSDGADVDAGGDWVSTATVLGRAPTADARQNCLAAVGQYLAVVQYTSTTDIQAQVLDTATALVAATCNVSGIGTSTTFNNVISDGANFFYMGNNGALVKFTTNGTVVWQKITSQNANVLVFDPVRQRLLVGHPSSNTMGTSSKFATVSVADGTATGISDPGSATGWLCGSADGSGGFVLWKQAATLNVMRMASDLSTTWGPLTLGGAVHRNCAANTGENLVTGADLGVRNIRLLAVSNGDIKRYDADNDEWDTLTGGSGVLTASAHVTFSTQHGLDMYFVDGSNYVYYDAETDLVATWTATAGSLPVDSYGFRGRLIDTWRGRLVISGLQLDPQNWFMSAVNDPLDWDYAPESPSSTDAVAGNNAPAGKVGDIINTIIPYNDDVLIFGGDHTIWQMSGDPLAGGQIDLISDTIGMAWGRPWCKGPDGTLYFFASRGGVWRMVPGQQPVRLSQQISDRLRDVNIGSTIVRMAWDDHAQGLHLFLTPLDETDATTHYFWESRVNAWWPDVFGNTDHNPKTVHVFDGDDPADRVVLLGSWDGYLRYHNPEAIRDDGTNIASHVVLGPLLTKDQDEVLLKDLQAILSDSSGDVTYAVHVGSTAESALTAEAVVTGTWNAGRNPLSFVRRSGHAIYVKLSATSPWALELIRARVSGTGKVRGRG